MGKEYDMVVQDIPPEQLASYEITEIDLLSLVTESIVSLSLTVILMFLFSYAEDPSILETDMSRFIPRLMRVTAFCLIR